LIGDSERLDCNRIGKGIVINVLRPFISRHNVVNMVDTLLVFLDTTDPEISNCLDDWSSFFFEPF
jgi:hypothetical protein